jgi:enoyl-CoA hydratase
MTRFQTRARTWGIEVVFDDGGMNLLSSSALEELRAVVAELRAAPAALIAFRSGRPGLFAAGADIAEMQRFSAADAERFSRLGQEIFDGIEQLPSLAVCLIDGDCFGGALDLSLAFDVRIGTASSRFSHPGARLGIATGFGGTTRWRKVTDRRGAAMMFLANSVLDARNARHFGVVDEIVDLFDGREEERLEAMARIDGQAIRVWKDLRRHADRLSQGDLLLLARRVGELYFR